MLSSFSLSGMNQLTMTTNSEMGKMNKSIRLGLANYLEEWLSNYVDELDSEYRPDYF